MGHNKVSSTNANILYCILLVNQAFFVLSYDLENTLINVIAHLLHDCFMCSIYVYSFPHVL